MQFLVKQLDRTGAPCICTQGAPLRLLLRCAAIYACPRDLRVLRSTLPEVQSQQVPHRVLPAFQAAFFASSRRCGTRSPFRHSAHTAAFVTRPAVNAPTLARVVVPALKILFARGEPNSPVPGGETRAIVIVNTNPCHAAWPT